MIVTLSHPFGKMVEIKLINLQTVMKLRRLVPLSRIGTKIRVQSVLHTDRL